MLVGFWGVLGGQSRLRKCLGERESPVCALKYHKIQRCWWLRGDSMQNWSWEHAGMPQKVSLEPEKKPEKDLCPNNACTDWINGWINDWTNALCASPASSLHISVFLALSSPPSISIFQAIPLSTALSWPTTPCWGIRAARHWQRSSTGSCSSRAGSWNPASTSWCRPEPPSTAGWGLARLSLGFSGNSPPFGAQDIELEKEWAAGTRAKPVPLPRDCWQS